MKKLLAGAALAFLFAGSAAADTYVQGHYTANGTYVQPHYRTDPNNTRNDNYSTRGNVNPYTGQPGTRPRDEGTPTYGTTYRAPRTTTTQQPSSSPFGSSYRATPRPRSGF